MGVVVGGGVGSGLKKQPSAVRKIVAMHRKTSIFILLGLAVSGIGLKC